MTATVPGVSADLVRDDGCAVLVVRGELDLATAPVLQAALAPLLPASVAVHELVVDLGELHFADLAGLAPLLQAQRALAARGGRVVLRRPPRVVRRLVEALTLQRVLLLPDALVPAPR